MGEMATLRISGQYKKETGLQLDPFLGLDNKIREYGLRAKLLVEPSETVTVNLSAVMSDQKSVGWTIFAIAIALGCSTPIDPDGPGPAPTLPLSVDSNGAFTDPAGCNIPVINARAEVYGEDSRTQMRARPTPDLGSLRVPEIEGLYPVEPFMHPGGSVFGAGRATAIQIMDDMGFDYDKVCGGPI